MIYYEFILHFNNFIIFLVYKEAYASKRHKAYTY